MPTITFIEPDGTAHAVNAGEGDNTKDVALNAGLTGIVGLCGGFANCGTCHVYVDAAWVDRLPPMEEAEDMMLDGTVSERLPNSRLACQILVSESLDGLILHCPPEQV